MSNVQTMTETVGKIFEAAQTIVDGMSDGERKQIKTLASDVSAAVGLDEKVVFNFVNHFAHETTVAYVTRGKNGGLVKGTRPAKVVKQKKVKVAKTDTTTVADTTDSNQ